MKVVDVPRWTEFNIESIYQFAINDSRFKKYLPEWKRYNIKYNIFFIVSTMWIERLYLIQLKLWFLDIYPKKLMPKKKSDKMKC